MSLPWVRIGACLAFIGVALGAFGAHGLEERLSAEQLQWWNTAVQYQLIHALALVLLGALQDRRALPSGPGLAFLVGTLLFSGTLYAMALGAPRGLGMVTPVGGLGFLLGWLWLAHAGGLPRSR